MRFWSHEAVFQGTYDLRSFRHYGLARGPVDRVSHAEIRDNGGFNGHVGTHTMLP